jgi:hypothetical protein
MVLDGQVRSGMLAAPDISQEGFLSLALFVTAIGHIGGGGHVEPYPHASIYALHPTTVQNVYAPATGNVISLFDHAVPGIEGGWKIMFRSTDNFTTTSITWRRAYRRP